MIGEGSDEGGGARVLMRTRARATASITRVACTRGRSMAADERTHGPVAQRGRLLGAECAAILERDRQRGVPGDARRAKRTVSVSPAACALAEGERAAGSNSNPGRTRRHSTCSPAMHRLAWRPWGDTSPPTVRCGESLGRRRSRHESPTPPWKLVPRARALVCRAPVE